MVYYYTSANVKMLRNIILDYEVTKDTTPCEYMKSYIEKCPEDTEDAKLSWIAETFLSIKKHWPFLKELSTQVTEELSGEEKDYFMIIFHAVTFQIQTKDMQLLYKCIFNLSKPLLYTFTKLLSNNEVLTYISQTAQSDYDTNYITDKIIGPLFTWQPYISEMAHNYAEHVKRVEGRKIKPPTVPVQPTVLTRKGKEAPALTVLPTTPPNSIRTKSKMLTKSVIDRKLKHTHEQNKHRADSLLRNVKKFEYHYAQTRNTDKRFSEDKDNTEYVPQKSKPRLVIKCTTAAPVRENAAAIKRINKRIEVNEQDEINWLEALVTDCRNTKKVSELIEHDRQEKERERLLDIEKKHLMGQISHEEAVIAKMRVLDDNKKKYEEFLKEKELWNLEIDIWKKIQMEKCRKQIEKLSFLELNVIEAKNLTTLRKKEAADKIKKESEVILAKAIKEKQEELERRVKMIKEIKVLAMIAKKAKIPRIIDFTETAGLGLLCEMSISELQERLSSIKMEIKDELDRKKEFIKQENLASKHELERVKTSIKHYMRERAVMRKASKKHVKHETSSSKEVNDLKRILEEKKKLRLKLAS